jgi:hypothetical protein
MKEIPFGWIMNADGSYSKLKGGFAGTKEGLNAVVSDSNRRLREAISNHENKPDCKLSNTKPKRDKKAALGGSMEGKAGGVPRTTVRFVGYRVRPLDPDNFAGSVKDLLDGLRHARLIPGDESWRIRLETEQVKVNHFKEEKTTIEITTP